MKNRGWGWKASLGGAKRWRERRKRKRLKTSFGSGRKRSAGRWTKRSGRPPVPKRVRRREELLRKWERESAAGDSA